MCHLHSNKNAYRNASGIIILTYLITSERVPNDISSQYGGQKKKIAGRLYTGTYAAEFFPQKETERGENTMPDSATATRPHLILDSVTRPKSITDHDGKVEHVSTETSNPDPNPSTMKTCAAAGDTVSSDRGYQECWLKTYPWLQYITMKQNE